MIINVHLIKNYPAANLNRDDSNSVKTMFYGGYQRTRISSQCLKHAVRASSVFEQEMTNLLGEGCLAMRTRTLPEHIYKILITKGLDEERANIMATIFNKFGTSDDKSKKNSPSKQPTEVDDDDEKTNDKNPDKRTTQVLFFSNSELDCITDAIITFLSDTEISNKQLSKMTYTQCDKALSKIIKEQQKDNPYSESVALGIALTGRMSTSLLLSSRDACIQVAHAFSTNEYVADTDFYITADDCLQGANAGAASAGNIDFNCACMYFNFSLFCDDIDDIIPETENKNTIKKEVILSIIRNFILTNPTAKQNSFAANAVPSAICIEFSNRNTRINYADAFVNPVKADNEADLVENSIKQLSCEIDYKAKDYGDLIADKRIWFCTNKYSIAPTSVDVSVKSMQELMNTVKEEI